MSGGISYIFTDVPFSMFENLSLSLLTESKVWASVRLPSRPLGSTPFAPLSTDITGTQQLVQLVCGYWGSKHRSSHLHSKLFLLCFFSNSSVNDTLIGIQQMICTYWLRNFSYACALTNKWWLATYLPTLPKASILPIAQQFHCVSTGVRGLHMSPPAPFSLSLTNDVCSIPSR